MIHAELTGWVDAVNGLGADVRGARIGLRKIILKNEFSLVALKQAAGRGRRISAEGREPRYRAQWSPKCSSPTGISTGTVLVTGASGHAQAGSYAQLGL